MTLRDRVHTQFKQHLYTRLSYGWRYSRGSLLSAWRNCIDEEATHIVWDMFEDMRVVDLVEEPDDLCTDDLLGDCYEDYHADTIPGGLRELRAQKKSILDKLDREGQWCFSSRVRLPGRHWERVDSIGGFIGMDGLGESGYLPQLEVAALDAMADYYGAPQWRGCCEDVRQRAFVFMAALAMSGVDMPCNWQEKVAWPSLV